MVNNVHHSLFTIHYSLFTIHQPLGDVPRAGDPFPAVKGHIADPAIGDTPSFLPLNKVLPALQVITPSTQVRTKSVLSPY
jgi:hypothetical protein